MSEFTVLGIGWFVITALVGAVMFVAELPPDQAVSNLFVWAERLHIPVPVSWQLPSVDRVVSRWAKLALTILLLVGIGGAVALTSKSISAIGLAVSAAGLVIFGAW